MTMATPIQKMLDQALKDFEAHLREEGKLRESSLGHRLRGAEDFALFLTGKVHKTERVRGVLSK
jgi:hypothetical protein